MKKTVILLSLAFIFSSCASHSFKSEFDFANSLARQGLWKEAGYRWSKAIQEGNKSAAVHNNLAISYEFDGKLELAMKEYKKALNLLPGNKYILQNIKKLKIRMGILKSVKRDKSSSNKKKSGRMK